jgi:hypothetical protein
MAGFITPFGDLVWCGVNGDTTVPNTRFDANGDKIEASILLHGEEAQQFKSELEEIVNKGLGALAAAEPHNADKIWACKHVPGALDPETGGIRFKFKTNTPPALYDASGEKASPGENWLIGNGSKGRFQIGVGRAYMFGKVSGVSFFLNQIQITELVEPSGGFDAAEGGFTKADNPPAFPTDKQASAAPPAPAQNYAAPPAPAPAQNYAAPPAPAPAQNYAAPPAPAPAQPSFQASPVQQAAPGITDAAELERFTQALKGLE